MWAISNKVATIINTNKAPSNSDNKIFFSSLAWCSHQTKGSKTNNNSNNKYNNNNNNAYILPPLRATHIIVNLFQLRDFPVACAPQTLSSCHMAVCMCLCVCLCECSKVFFAYISSLVRLSARCSLSSNWVSAASWSSRSHTHTPIHKGNTI